MQPCECGSHEFIIDAIYTAKDRILLIPVEGDNENFEVLDTTYYDGEWEDHADVTCADCGKVTEYQVWQSQEPIEVT